MTQRPPRGCVWLGLWGCGGAVGVGGPERLGVLPGGAAGVTAVREECLEVGDHPETLSGRQRGGQELGVVTPGGVRGPSQRDARSVADQ